MIRNLIAVIALVFLLSCNKRNHREAFLEPDMLSQTVYQLNSVVMGNNFSPVVASRNYAYASIAAYEIVANAFPDKYRSLAGQLRDLKDIPKPAPGQEIDHGYAALIAYCKVGEAVTFPEGSMDDYIAGLREKAKQFGMPAKVMRNSEAYAQSVVKAIMAWSKDDNYLKTRGASKYTISDEPGKWQPTPPMYADAAEPHWMNIRPMVLDSASQFRAPAPPVYDFKDTSGEYYKEVMLIKTTVENLTDEQKHIADFWDDNPFKLNVYGHVQFSSKKFSPPGHWMGIAGIACKKSNADFATTAYTYAKLSIALFDAFIHCWDSKYFYATCRPETVINKHFDPDWSPYLQTPAFPEYTAGHSTVSASAAEILTSIFGDNFAYTDTTELEFGIASRSFKSFRDAALENNLARFYGGIHFQNSCKISNECGRKVGELIVTRLKMKDNLQVSKN